MMTRQVSTIRDEDNGGPSALEHEFSQFRRDLLLKDDTRRFFDRSSFDLTMMIVDKGTKLERDVTTGR